MIDNSYKNDNDDYQIVILDLEGKKEITEISAILLNETVTGIKSQI